MATHGVFQKFVEQNGLEFFNIGGDPVELMAFVVKNPGLVPSVDSVTSGEIAKRRREMKEILIGCWRSCFEAGDGTGPAMKAGDGRQNRDTPFIADAIVANPPSSAHVHLAEKMGIPLHIMFT